MFLGFWNFNIFSVLKTFCENKAKQAGAGVMPSSGLVISWSLDEVYVKSRWNLVEAYVKARLAQTQKKSIWRYGYVLEMNWRWGWGVTGFNKTKAISVPS